MTLFNDPLKGNDPLKKIKIDLFIIYRELRKKCRIPRPREFVAEGERQRKNCQTIFPYIPRRILCVDFDI